ncbi:unnamed protein product, partial [Rotaria sordida]
MSHNESAAQFYELRCYLSNPTH